MVFTFNVQINGVNKPYVWREVVVSEEITFAQFHTVLQAAFGWKDYHTYLFCNNGYESKRFIGEMGESPWRLMDDSKLIKLKEVFTKKGNKFFYIYDLWDSWVHTIKVVKMDSGTIKFPALINWEGLTPCEDCGGSKRYTQLKKIVNEPDHKLYDEMRMWAKLKAGEKFNPYKFEEELIKRRVRKSLDV